MLPRILIFLMVILPLIPHAQNLKSIEEYLRLDARGDDPLFTTYAASMQRSRLYGDKAYKMDYYSDCLPVTYTSDQAGSMFCIWKIDEVVVGNIGEFFAKPVVIFSFPDMAILEYQPFRGIHIRETFFVYSSKIAMVEMEVRNVDAIPHEVVAYPVLELGNDSLEIMGFDSVLHGYITHRNESLYRLISSLKPEYGYPTRVRDLFTSNQKPNSYGAYRGRMPDFQARIKTDYYTPLRDDKLNSLHAGFVDFISLQLNKRLRPGEQVNFRYIRGVQSQQEEIEPLHRELESMKNMHLRSYFDDNLILYSRIPRIQFNSTDDKLVYIGAFNLVRGSIYPPEGKTTHNFYVFSRNPLWGWGHGHQVLHESLSMLSYVYMDPNSAEGSQRVFMEQQRADGLIAYRHGPRGLQDYPHKKMSTTSAPFFSWINWEIYQVSKDRAFLEEAYKAGVSYTNWMIENRDNDHDGTYEWGPYGLIENVRDWYNAVFQVSAERYLDVDKEDISDELECLDLTLMMIKEERSLAAMARVLGKPEEAGRWLEKAETTSRLVNERMWDDSTGFYYSVNRDDHGWHFMTRDLRRQEIIGFMALWAGVAPPERAAQLVKTLSDTTKFWRRYGIPTLSADDPWYSPNVDYCCKWNGPVWLLWEYMVYEGLRDYGYQELAHRLAEKMLDCVITQLKKNHQFWESYSADNEVLNSPSNYIWDSIMAKLLIEENKTR